jgi:hypothetical protein
MLAVHVIDRAPDRDRPAAFEAAAARHGITPLRIEAVDALAPAAFARCAALLPDVF